MSSHGREWNTRKSALRKSLRDAVFSVVAWLGGAWFLLQVGKGPLESNLGAFFGAIAIAVLISVGLTCVWERRLPG